MKSFLFSKKLIPVAVCAVMFLACTSNNGKSSDTPPHSESEDSTSVTMGEPPADDTYSLAIDRFLIDSIGAYYAEGEYCIPTKTIIDVDDKNTEDILVYGDYWVFNYNLVGDTLKTVSGGDHPGLMHVKQTYDRFEVIAFDRVEDGSDYLPSAQKIFGDKFNEFQHISSDEKTREQNRMKTISEYVKKNNIPATMYQDYGWDAIAF